MKKLLIYITLINFSFMIAQPIPKCVDATKRLFLTCCKDTILYNTDINTLEAIGFQESCFRIRDIKDSLSIKLFKIKIYQSNRNFQKKNEKKMIIFLTHLMVENSFNYYLNILEFKEGNYFIDVSKKNTIKKVGCYMCRDSVDAIDVTPDKWEKRKKWRN